MRFEVWSEGYAATGEHGRAMHHGSFEAANFQEACDQAFTREPSVLADVPPLDPDYDRENLTIWGCKLFTNEAEARMSFG